MSKGRDMRVPAIPTVTDNNLRDVVEAMARWIQTREGRLGDGLDKAVTFRDIGRMSLVGGDELRRAASGQPVTPTFPGLPTAPTAPADLTPPAPTDLQASGALTTVILTWKMAPFPALDYFEVWRSPTAALGDATLVITTTSPVTADTPPSGSTFYYWVRARSIYNKVGPYNDAAGTPASLAPNPAVLLGALTGAITETQLYQTLRDRIDLVDGPNNLAGSVAARLKAETDARVAALLAETNARALAIQAETDARIDAIDAEILARSNGDTQTYQNATTYTANYAYSRVEVDGAVTAMANQLRAEFVAGDGGQTLAAAKAYTESWAYSRAQADSAIAASQSILRAEFTAADQTTRQDAESYVQNYTYARSTIDSSLASQQSSLTAAFQAADNGVRSDAQAYTQNYTYARSTIDQTVAGLTTSLRAEFTQSDDAVFSQAKSYVQGYTYSQSQIDGANATQTNALTAAFQQADSGVLSSANSYTATYAYSRAQVDSSLSSVVQTLRAEYTRDDGAVLSQAQSYVQTYTYARSAIDGAFTTQANQLAVAWQNADAGVLTQANSYVQSYTYARGTIDGAINGVESRLRSEYQQGDSGLLSQAQSYTTTYAYAKADGQALAGSLSNLSTTVGNQGNTLTNVSATLQTEQQVNANFRGYAGSLYTVRTEVSADGRTIVGGFGLAGTAAAGQGPTIDFGVAANRFWVSPPAGTGGGVPSVLPFVVQTTPVTVNGVQIPAGVYMDAAFITNLTTLIGRFGQAWVDDAKIANLSAAKLTAGDGTIGGILKSSNYVPGQSGWRIAPDGAAEFSGATVRGYITAWGGAIGGMILVNNSLYSANYVPGASGFRLWDTGNAEFNNVTVRGTVHATDGSFAGQLNVSSGGASRLEITTDRISVFNNGVERVRLGRLV